MKYSPNFNDTRVRRRCEKALNWLYDFKTNKPSQLSKTLINKYLGRSNDQLGRWLRDRLLVVEDPYFNPETHVCKKYVRNKQGMQELESALHGNVVKPSISEKLQQQLNSGEIEYTERSDRLHSPLQNIPRVIRRPLLSSQGYRYHYDIKCSAPTLIKNHAQQLGLTDPTPALDQYLNDRTAIRQKLAVELLLTEDQVKEIINALLNGARLSASWDSSIWKIINKNYQSFELLKSNEFLISLRNDFKVVWRIIENSLPRETIICSNGSERKKVFSSRRKSQVYRSLEIQVIKEIRRYMKRNKIRSLLMHDGWTCDRMIDPYELRTLIKNSLGYNIDIDMEIYEYV